MGPFIFFGYIFVFSLVAIIVTAVDKRAAMRNKTRISENALLIIAALGGSFAMFPSMLWLRHKTKHLKFMVGLPIIIILHIALMFFVVSPLLLADYMVATFNF